MKRSISTDPFRHSARRHCRQRSRPWTPCWRSPSDVELLLVIVMLAIGGTVALAVGISVAAAQRESGSTVRPAVPPDRNHIAASLLFNLLLAGGIPPDQALRAI